MITVISRIVTQCEEEKEGCCICKRKEGCIVSRSRQERANDLSFPLCTFQTEKVSRWGV